MTNAYKLSVLFVSVLMSSQTPWAKEVLPKIEGYTKGELEIKTTAFGDKNPITVGKVNADGVIHFDWPNIDLQKINENEENRYSTTSIDYYIGGKFCKDPSAALAGEDATLVKNGDLYLYKYGGMVGVISPSTQTGDAHRSELLGSTVSWVYSNGAASAQANCRAKKEWEELYSFDETTAYELKLRNGWNLVSNTLSALEEWQENGVTRTLPKTRAITSIEKLPTTLNWHLKYFANDELLDIEQHLLKTTPIAQQRYEAWLPAALGSLTRTSYEVGKKLERIPITNNVQLLFASGDKTVKLTVVDCAGSKESAGGFTMMHDMASRDWHDKAESGYSSAQELDGKRVITEYNEQSQTTEMNYNTNGRFVVKAEAENMGPDELWGHLKTLDFDALVKI